MSDWRAVGINYLGYSFIAATLLRRSLKPEWRLRAQARGRTAFVIREWKNGKPGQIVKE